MLCYASPAVNTSSATPSLSPEFSSDEFLELAEPGVMPLDSAPVAGSVVEWTTARAALHPTFGDRLEEGTLGVLLPDAGGGLLPVTRGRVAN
jgi:hypothetical protein